MQAETCPGGRAPPAAGWAIAVGGDPARVREEALPHLSMEQIHTAIDWYHEHQQEIDDILRQREEDYQRGLARMKAAQ